MGCAAITCFSEAQGKSGMDEVSEVSRQPCLNGGLFADSVEMRGYFDVVVEHPVLRV